MCREFQGTFSGFSHFFHVLIITFESQCVLKLLVVTIPVTSSAIKLFRLIKLHFKCIELDFFFSQGLNESQILLPQELQFGIEL